ncbi:MAG: hypothetical protein ACRCVJ_18855 [Clostridium sp.]|uniref:hypothetical protein n=1 Tax=Clostridium sp. TaxID=1506 RepID=UPI003F324F59
MNKVLGNLNVDNEVLSVGVIDTCLGKVFNYKSEETGSIGRAKFEDILMEVFDMGINTIKECLKGFQIWGGNLVQGKGSICIYDRLEQIDVIISEDNIPNLGWE